MITNHQWKVLTYADRPGGAEVNSYISTMAALNSKHLIRFGGTVKKPKMFPTKLGKEYLAHRNKFQKTPAFEQCRTNIKLRYR